MKVLYVKVDILYTDNFYERSQNISLPLSNYNSIIICWWVNYLLTLSLFLLYSWISGCQKFSKLGGNRYFKVDKTFLPRVMLFCMKEKVRVEDIFLCTANYLNVVDIADIRHQITQSTTPSLEDVDMTATFLNLHKGKLKNIGGGSGVSFV